MTAPAAQPREQMRQLRALVLEAIEALRPTSDAPAQRLQARSYEMLHRHYVQGLMVVEVARELAISRRQAYRSLRQAEQELASLLREQLSDPSPNAEIAAGTSSVHSELARLPGNLVSLPLSDLLAAAAQSVAPLAQRQGVTLRTGPSCGETLRTIRAVARQAVLYALSAVIQAAQPGSEIMASCDLAEGQGLIVLTLSDAQALPNLVVVSQLLANLGGSCEAEQRGPEVTLQLRLPSLAPLTVLVIDDNQGLSELFRRFLADADYRVHGETDPDRALAQVAELHPDVIFMDVMMPRRDGWQLLQQLRGDPTTAELPIIVCSVLDDPALALALGATAFISKPVSRATLLAALAEVASSPRSPAAPAALH